MSKTTNKSFKITLTAVLSAAAFALMFIEFPVPFMPPFIKFDISDLPALFASLFVGPFYGVIVELIKNILHILIKGTTSAFIGELSNFLLGSVFVLTSGLICRKSAMKHKEIFATIIGALLMGLICVPINYFIVYPAYVKCYNLPLEAIIEMYKNILDVIMSKPTNNVLLNCLVVFNFPFTLGKGLIDAIICIAVYKPISKAIKVKNND